MLTKLERSFKLRLLTWILCLSVLTTSTQGLAKPLDTDMISRSIKVGNAVGSALTLGLLFMGYQEFERLKNEIPEISRSVWFFPPMDFGTRLDVRKAFDIMKGLEAKGVNGYEVYDPSLGSIRRQIQVSQNVLISEMVFAGLWGTFYLIASPLDVGDPRFISIASTIFLFLYSIGVSAAITDQVVNPAFRISDSLTPFEEIPAVNQSGIPEQVSSLAHGLHAANNFCWSTLAIPAGNFFLFPLIHYGVEQLVSLCRKGNSGCTSCQTQSECCRPRENLPPRDLPENDLNNTTHPDPSAQRDVSGLSRIEGFREWNNRMSARGGYWVNQGMQKLGNSARTLVAIPVQIVKRSNDRPPLPRLEGNSEVPPVQIEQQAEEATQEETAIPVAEVVNQ